MLMAHAVEDMTAGVSIPLATSELNAVVGQYRMDLVGYGGNQVAQELGGDHFVSFLVQLGVGDLAGAVDGDETGIACLLPCTPRQCPYERSQSGMA
jgi:hypothetical protein